MAYRIICKSHGILRSGATLLQVRYLSTSNDRLSNNYRAVVVGGGAGGLAMASILGSKFGKAQVAVVEPSDNHYYQPMWTMVGGGLKTFGQSARMTKDVFPSKATWIQDSAVGFDPDNNTVLTKDGKQLKYDILVVAMGLQLRFEQVKGLQEALDNDPMVCSNYSADTVLKTFPAIQKLEAGNAIFTFPNTPIKCAGAPQKIMYLAEHYFSKHGKRDKINIIYNSSLPVIFGVQKYANELLKIVEKRNIDVNFRHNLVEVNHEKKEAVFVKLDSENQDTVNFNYDFLHVTPPMSPPEILKNSPIAAENGFLSVHKETGQHTKYPNVFGIGDCTDIPTAKTAAAVAAQSGVLKKTIEAVLSGKEPQKLYDGYTSCPLVVGYNKCILAEFDFNAQPLETFPIDQGKQRRSMYYLKKDMMPEFYWKGLIKGKWAGPGGFRKAFRLGMGK
ncbi:sulfide:quinone oxidoreductase, mitochondrial-like [Anneissia japonica]|uniref:sulfide:quinone oxidoreductase, mitochondrial-like n=1 Tax=Anneissia japonica TaxID=1529436 RepID=UPI0014254BA7|nr:sulfide:quinone oxidoreductase, mitochondrial-like [Anneissia japonica]XP_033126220.1 sulfide:quinone oxidoreductase, mitochondrial-like [Anneissia japonica]XP_033126221.1 sulfide:quinone oxidoreductase, mitochondrial-like [Anneissia japonica]